MVNLRKVGAIATGALFVGATLGMAAAVTVPSDFKASMLADKGVAKAQLVVGKNAPGKTADKASAKIIQDAAKTKLSYTVPGGDIKISYGSKRWDDSDQNLNFRLNNGTEWDDPISSDSNVDGTLLDVGKGDYGYLRIDKNGDGDFKDSADYNLYSDLYVIDGSAGIVQFVFNFSTDQDSAFSPDSGWPGTTFKAKGKRYTLTSVESDKEIKMGPTLRVTLTSVSQDFAANAVTLDGTRKFAYQDSLDGNTLYFIDGNEIQQQLDVPTGSHDSGARIPDSSITADSFEDYKIFLKTSGATAYAWAVRKNDEISLVDEQTDVLGYDKVYIDTDASTGSPTFTAGGEGNIYFVDDPISLRLDSTVDVPGTEYYIKWKTSKTMQLRRKKAVTVVSGTKLRSTMSDYSPFLSADIITTAVAGDIKITYGSKRWDDSGQNLKFRLNNGTELEDPISSDSNVDGTLLEVTKGDYGYLRIDKNGDGDFKDSSDYNIYSGLYVIDGGDGSVQPVYNFSTDRDSEYSLDSGLSGTTFKVKGKRYTLTEIEGDKEVKMGPTLRVTLGSVSQNFAANAVALDGMRKFAYQYSKDGTTLYFIDGSEIQQQLDVPTGSHDSGARIPDSSITADSFEDYKIFLKTNGATAYAWAVRKNDEISLVDEQTDVLGYDKVYIDTDASTGSPTFTAGGEGNIYFVDDPISLRLDSTVDVPGTEYEIKWKTNKEMQLRRKKAVTVVSGTKLRSTMSDYSPFLDLDITPYLTGAGETKMPTLEIVDEDTASSTMNHVLVGGPVANALVADLVTAGKSKVIWETSDGNIEVVSGHPAEGFDSIIVAGKTRKETKAAAKALADAL